MEKEGIKLSLFTKDIIIYIEYVNKLTKKTPELMSNYNKVVGFKINIQKSIAFLTYQK